MAIPARTAQPGTFFITTVTYNRRRLFQIPANAELFIATLQHYRQEGRYKLHAFAVMPDHVHLLLTPQSITLERAMGFIKGGFSRRLASNLPVWQRSFTDHRIRDKADYQTRLEYIHQNPVRAHLAEAASDYPYSSASCGAILPPCTSTSTPKPNSAYNARSTSATTESRPKSSRTP